MVTLFRRLFIKDYQEVYREDVRAAHGTLASVFGIVSNLILVALKITMAFVIQAQSGVLSIALVGDAINNLADMTSSLVTLIGFKVSSKPADKEHPFGHERIEDIAGLVVSTIVLVLAVELFRDSLSKIISGELVQYDLLTIIILAVSVVIKLIQSAFNRGMGKAISSEALKATAMDSFTDSIATFAILVSGILSYTLHYNFLDGYMGIVVSLFVLYSGIKMVKETAKPLIGEANSKDQIDAITSYVLSFKGVEGVHDVIAHSYGPTKLFVSLHAEVKDTMGIRDAHELIDDVEKKTGEKFRCQITIHMDPIAVGDPETDELKSEVKEVLEALSPTITFHDFRIVSGNAHTNIIFDVVLPYEVKMTKEEVTAALDERFKGRKKTYSFVLGFDRPFDE